ncbi:MAG: DUF3795 domain-containing protein [Ruminococcus sp.]|nr:DUF3795 domain-containing protein [Ruminococcus sp.]
MKDRTYFDGITPCGENCTGCKKKQDGICMGCIEADGYVPEWKESGRCRIFACVREHGALFCGVCREFPCEKVTELLHWKKDPVGELSQLAEQYRQI